MHQWSKATRMLIHRHVLITQHIYGQNNVLLPAEKILMLRVDNRVWIRDCIYTLQWIIWYNGSDAMDHLMLSILMITIIIATCRVDPQGSDNRVLLVMKGFKASNIIYEKQFTSLCFYILPKYCSISSSLSSYQCLSDAPVNQLKVTRTYIHALTVLNLLVSAWFHNDIEEAMYRLSGYTPACHTM